MSLVVITKNESRNIERCLRSADWVDDIVVLDSESTDNTLDIARRLGARTFVEPFRGYRAQKERATQLAAHDWILSLDADEALSPELSKEILNVLGRQDPELDGVEIPRLSFHLGRWIRHGGWYPDWQIRLFHRRRAIWTGGHVHERVKAPRSLRAQHPILHWVFENLSDQVDTNNDYSTKGALDLFDSGKKFSLFKLIIKPWSKFFETYLVKRGFLDGVPGFIISIGAAYSVFLKFAKLWELERKKTWNG